MKDFFISYSGRDKQWADWIAATLTKGGFSFVMQFWDFRPGSNFVLQMHQATIECERTIAVLSPNWLASVFTQPEWTAAFALDPTGATRKLIPVRVQACEPPGLLRAIVYCDLVGLAEDDAKKELLNAVSDTAPAPASSQFPGAASTEQRFPGVSRSQPRKRMPSTAQCAFDLFGLLQTTRTTFEAQARLRDSLVRRIHDRLILNPYENWQYEEFFSRYFEQLDGEERRIFSTIRSFTTDILSDYNRRILKLVDDCPKLGKELRDIPALKRHLLVWLAKFEHTFLNTPSMCLLYTGVDEGVPFPSNLDRNLWQYLERQPKLRELLQGEPPPMDAFEEHGDGSENIWRFNLGKKWARKRISEIAAERAQHPDENRIRELDRELIEIVNLRVAGWRGVPLPPTLIAALRPMVLSPDPAWSRALRTSLEAVRPPVNEFNATGGIGSENRRKLLSEMPAILRETQSLQPESSLAREWNDFIEGLGPWALAELQ